MSLFKKNNITDTDTDISQPLSPDSAISSTPPSFEPRQLTSQVDLHRIIYEISQISLELPVVVFENVKSFADFATLEEQRPFRFFSYNSASKQVSLIEMPSEIHENLWVDILSF